MMMIDGVPKNEKRTKGAAEEGVLVFLMRLGVSSGGGAGRF